MFPAVPMYEGFRFELEIETRPKD